MQINPPNAIGYFAVILPDERMWQGFYLIPEDRTRRGEGAADGSPRPLDNTDLLLNDFRKVSDASDMSSRVIRSVPGVDLEDQALFGAVLAALVDRVKAHDEPSISALAAVIAKLAKTSYFWVEGRENSAGVATRFDRLSVASIDDARQAIKGLPQIMILETLRLIDRT